MKSFKIFFLFVLAVQILITEVMANENEALPEIPTLNIDTTKKQETPKTQDARIQDEDRNLVSSSDSNATNATNLVPMIPEDNSTKRQRDPFTPIITPKDSGQITNAPQLNLFTKTELVLPSTARKIKKITLEYQNLNGSLTTIEKELDGDIDWHFPLILHQEVQLKTPEIPDKQDFFLADVFEVELAKNTIALHTDFRLIRYFTLASPTRLILDFKAPSKRPLKDSFVTQIPIIPQVELDTHLDFYRVTLNLDGQYKYNLTQDAQNGRYFVEFY